MTSMSTSNPILSAPLPAPAAPMLQPAANTAPNGPSRIQSVQQIEQLTGEAQARMAQLVADRDADQQALQQCQQRIAQLKARVTELNERVAQHNQALFVLQPELDGLLTLRERVRRRAIQASQQLPARAPVRPDATAFERRISPRQPLAVDVQLQSESNFYVGFSQDISEGGLYVATYVPRPKGERFPIEFSLPGQNRLVRTMVEVAWVREPSDTERLDSGMPGMGLKFVGLAPEDGAAIAHFMGQREPLFFPEHDAAC